MLTFSENRQSKNLGFAITLFTKCILHRPGIEPGPPAWQASILPLNQRCFLTSVDKSQNSENLRKAKEKKAIVVGDKFQVTSTI